METFDTARAANPLFCHQDFLEKLAGHARDSIGKRAAFLLQRLSVDSQRLHYKTTQGINRGWRRSRLGGNHGSHFYAWWAPKGAAPLKELEDFSPAPEGALFLRDIRHHDDHTPLAANSLDSHYLPITVRDIRREEYGPLPWTQSQMRFATARQSVRLLKGHPGSGKTSALFHAADSSGAEEVLYVTYSRDLASLAREYFDRFCSSHKRFHVVTFPALIRQVLRVNTPADGSQEAKRRFFHDLAPFSRTLGPWANDHSALYDELYAHLAGDALPLDLGRFDACTAPRVSDKSYRKRRARFLGESAVKAVLEIAGRLEKLHSRSVTESYFPELALAWQAMEKLRGARASGDQRAVEPSLLKMGCIAVDECQDLTPLEAFFLVELTALTNSRRSGAAATLLLSGDEAQTVRPTDFEWGWLSDLLHSQISTPTEYKLSANLRSPQRIAELVNRVWDLYAHVDKHERPSGTGHAEIEDDATDQVLYSSAKPGAELDELFLSLSAREGLALITLEDAVPAYVPEKARHAVLTVSEAKGLDFNAVCVLDGGRHLERIIRDNARQTAGSDIEGLRRRLAIDQLRVALSRPTERLFWIDINPSEQIVRQSIGFLNGNEVEGGVASCVPSALLKTLEEDALDLEERVQLCQSDARQYLEVKPAIAWSRAQQAVSLLGRPKSLAAVTDEAARNAAFLTLAEVCFVLAVRNVQLAPELGKPDLFQEAQRAATNAKRFGLGLIIDAIGRLHNAKGETRLNTLLEVARLVPVRKAEIESWLLLEIEARSAAWLEELEAAVFISRNAAILLTVLPPFYEALALPDRQARILRLKQRAVQLMMKDRAFGSALDILRGLEERQPKLEATCYEGMGDFRRAAECHLATGNKKNALTCYRTIPDLEKALALVDEIGDHPAADSLRWMSELRALALKRPDKFNKVVMPTEKKLLEEILERSLGVTRAKPAARKAATKKAAAPRKRAVKTSKAGANPYF
jgi:superfamily I DNA/RNA helicase